MTEIKCIQRKDGKWDNGLEQSTLLNECYMTVFFVDVDLYYNSVLLYDSVKTTFFSTQGNMIYVCASK